MGCEMAGITTELIPRWMYCRCACPRAPFHGSSCVAADHEMEVIEKDSRMSFRSNSQRRTPWKVDRYLCELP
jgi:hypothetical protein